MPDILKRETVGNTQTYPIRIVQFGGGNFLRAFVDWIVQVLNEETDFNSGIALVKATPGSYAKLDAQDNLYHVHLHGIQDGNYTEQTKLITSISQTTYPYQEGGFSDYLGLAQQPDVRFIFSNTTESGIEFASGDKLTDTPPSTFPAKLTVFLHKRFQAFDGAGDKGCIIIPTELIDDNGIKLREIILQYADLWELGDDFKQWINDHNMFCNTLVDRIIPGYPEADAERIFESLGYEDKMLVAGEIYHSWIIEAPQSLLDEFPVNLAKTSLNVKIVDDASPYRVIKVRLLNGAHTSMVPIGFLLGLESVRESMEHPVLGQFIPDLIFKEVIPSIGDDVAEDELQAFARDVFDRFLNPHIHHRLLTIALNTSSKIKERILPSVKGYYAKTGELPQRLVIALGAFIRFYKSEWQGEAIPLNDDADTLAWFKQTWETADSVEGVVTTVLSNTDLWDEDLTQIDGLTSAVTDAIQAIDEGRLMDVLRKSNG